MSRPVIGVTAYRHMIDDTFLAQICGERTPEAVAAVAGGLPLILPGMPDAASTGELVDLLDGLVLTGARPNVHPECYGEAETEAHGPFDRGRDGVTLPLIRAMTEAGKPVFGICRGIQEMNVAYGGTLHPEIRDLPGRMNHRMPKGEKDHGVIFAKRHRVHFREGGAFHRLLGITEAETNSLHGQAVWSPGGRIVLEGHADDGTVEAISIDGARAFALGVQWHAEYDAVQDPLNRALFEAFGADARAARDARSGRRGAA
ncbi:gamma-glutamyl-gamma-aminobutyrate hydrolase family protein [Limibaculum sp. M0105]|uniref:gamma-glutamyl-gamma-aminobutyrate hydrolase n=1 Tax=Thermohalobaculum xanthum TaxID=2753746 RepID=A0A8J7M5N2_9RHOB|nr:gamma-glutamyl-gamma-aminobutyrate hydrolase family protein [Thermohalobaculum xanthum]MBK0398613.1 gamma-glutamyl-gamma-aminobutyrate hydrolase family protein [Thermohalobaculum xanthum]